MAELERQLGERQVRFKLTDAARGWLAERGYDRLYGARPLARVIQEHVKKPLADEVLFGRLAKGGVVKIDVRDNKLAFEVLESKSDPTPEPEDKVPEPVA
jgi:ATP-dependent Clp protease ATP-binding subunit ClpA